jgi:hypothetical protein
MVQYKNKKVLYSMLRVFWKPQNAWSNSLGWIMVKFMYVQMTNVILKIDTIINYVALTCDKVNDVNNVN